MTAFFNSPPSASTTPDPPEVHITLTIWNSDGKTHGRYSPKGPYKVELGTKIIIKLDNQTGCDGGIVNFAATGENKLRANGVPFPQPRSEIELMSHLTANELVDFGILVKVNSIYHFFDPQASNDPR